MVGVPSFGVSAQGQMIMAREHNIVLEVLRAHGELTRAQIIPECRARGGKAVGMTWENAVQDLVDMGKVVREIRSIIVVYRCND
jgi:hypothetical protein